MILFYVQHLLGSGHVHRVRLLAGELAARGLKVTVVSGGMPVTGMDAGAAGWVQLEPLRSDGLDFANLVDADGEAADANLYARRVQQLLDTYRRCRPRVLVIETFPFGRRQFRHELGALLELANGSPARPTIVCSIRDILQRRDARREEETVRVLERFFDAVLVHGDPSLIPLDASFEAVARISSKIVYTGYIAPAPVPRPWPVAASGEIVVSAGGGAAGQRLYEAALEAASRDSSGIRWRLLVGGGLDEKRFAALHQRATASLAVERNRSDFRELIAGSRMLVSQAGYNTLADVLVTGVPSLLVPFEGQGETEQLERARCFESLGRCAVLREADLDGAALLRAVSALLPMPEPNLPDMNLEGVAMAADWIGARAGAAG